MNEVSEGMYELFDLEINNEHIEETGQSRSGTSSPGGVNPATLGSCLDSLEQGLELDFYDTAEVEAELRALIAKFGPDTPVRDFLPDDE